MWRKTGKSERIRGAACMRTARAFGVYVHLEVRVHLNSAAFFLFFNAFRHAAPRADEKSQMLQICAKCLSFPVEINFFGNK